MNINFARGDVAYNLLQPHHITKAVGVAPTLEKGSQQSSALAKLLATLRGPGGRGIRRMSAREEFESIVSLDDKRPIITPDYTAEEVTKPGAVGAVTPAQPLNEGETTTTRLLKRIRGNKAANRIYRHLSAREQLIQLKAVDLGQDYGGMPGACRASDCKVAGQKKYYPSLYISDRPDDLDLPMSGTATIKYKLRSKTTRQDEEGKKKHSAEIEVQSIDPDTEEEKPIKDGANPLKFSAREKLDTIKLGITSILAAGQKPFIGKLNRAQAIGYGLGGIATGGIIANELSKIKKNKKRGVEQRVPEEEGGTILSAREKLNLICFGDPRPRNNLGEFSQPEDGAPSPNAIDSVYKQPARDAAIASGGLAGGSGATLAIQKLMKRIKK